MDRIQVKRTYEPPEKTDGARFLVDRLWPRGIKKEALPLAGWIKEVAPSRSLRQWFAHDPLKWEEFRNRYLQEIESHKELVEPIRKALRTGPVTLLYSAKDQKHNNAVVLAEFLCSSR